MNDLADELGVNIEPEAPVRKLKAKAVEAPKKFKIILEESDEIPPNGLFVQANGRSFIVPTGRPVEVPEVVKDILDHAIISIPRIDPKTKRRIGQVDRKRFNYSLVS